MTQRDISYGELFELNCLFDSMTSGHQWEDEEQKDECLFDFVDQYINGNDNPKPRYL